MKRNEIDEKFKWDITTIYKNIEKYEKDFAQVKNNIPKFEQYKGNFLDNVDRFLEFMELYETTSRKLTKLSMYSHLQIDVDPKNEEIQNLESRIQGLSAMYSEALVFMDIEIGNNLSRKSRQYLTPSKKGTSSEVPFPITHIRFPHPPVSCS